MSKRTSLANVDNPGVVSIRLRRSDSTCTCGCYGADSWHKRHLPRKVRAVTTLDSPVDRWFHPSGERVVATGVARFPWGEEEVEAVQTLWSNVPPRWIADPASMDPKDVKVGESSSVRWRLRNYRDA